jgi:hypothetical protein
MVNCSKFGKKLRFSAGHNHPIQWENHLICRKCFDVINKSIEFYKKCLFEGRQNHKTYVIFGILKIRDAKMKKTLKT